MRTVRITSGLVMLYYVVVHLTNHALGNISLDLMESAQPWTVEFFRTDIGTVILGGAALTHFTLALWAVYLRRRFSMPAWEAVQIILGFTIPLLLIKHIVAARLARDIFGAESGYSYVIWGMQENPWNYVLQSALLIVAWAHGCMGIHYWLRFRAWYPKVSHILAFVALVLPLMALNGFLQAVREVDRLDLNPRYARAFRANAAVVGDDGVTRLAKLEMDLFLTLGAIAVGLLCFRVLRRLFDRYRGIIQVTFPGGQTASIRPGPTVLEISRAMGLPHASVCGGRARCSTCRVRIGGGLEILQPPAATEARVLDRMGAAPNVRLACQIRPTADIEVTPLFPVPPDLEEVRHPVDYHHGREVEIAVMFVDLRGFTAASEHQLPYDTVFLLNRYFKEMGTAIQEAGGHIDKFMGDGIMALFALEHDIVRGTTNALRAAHEMGRRLRFLNAELSHDLKEPLKIGIGIHAGLAIVGKVGWGNARALTAIGDTVNTASRIEGLSKRFNCELVVSSEVARIVGTRFDGCRREEVDVRGRKTKIEVILIAQADSLQISGDILA
ncbi:MAG: adenylate/guanylate cyclase domain-containing protein [Rhodospirillaceae bacterium]